MGPGICPELLGRVDGGYIMEELRTVRYDAGRANLPDIVTGFLIDKVWSQDYLERVVPDRPGGDWLTRLDYIFGIRPPAAIALDAEAHPGCCHGDPTFSNVMSHPRLLELRLIDPCHRDYTPQTWGVDAGKILQSCLGWEQLQAGWDHTDYRLPELEPFAEDRLLIPVWWAGMHAQRILVRERRRARPRDHVLSWAEIVRDQCWSVE